jgi:hypothetical protein
MPVVVKTSRSRADDHGNDDGDCGGDGGDHDDNDYVDKDDGCGE